MTISKVVGILSIAIVVCCILLNILISTLYNSSLESNKAFNEERILNTLATELAISSILLTKHVRVYAITGQTKSEQEYKDVLSERSGIISRKKTRAIHPYERISLLNLMRKYGITEEELAKVNLSNYLSDKLVRIEEEAFNAAKGIFKDSSGQYTINREPDQAYALDLVFNDAYYAELAKIQKHLDEFLIMLRERSHQDSLDASELVYLNIILLACTISIILILAFMFMWYVRYKICMPLAQMADNVKCGNKGNFKETLFFSEENEIRILEKEFSKRVDIEDKLRENKVDLEDNVRVANFASDAKSLFLARMSHEIRNPMNSIIGMSGVARRKLEEESFNIEEIKIHIKQIEASSQHLLGLLNDILDISKIEAGKIELCFETFDLPNLVGNVATIIKPRCEEKNIKFITEIIGLEHNAYINDSLRLRQVLINLLGNAVKFTGERGTVEFLITQKDKRDGHTLIDFSIKDNGIGINEDELKRLFKPFSQSNKQISRKYGGTGLGLSISQSIVAMMGCSIVVSSSPGEGSEFSFTVWFKDSYQEIKKVVVSYNLDNLLDKCILVVDDVDINRMIVMEMLTPTGLKFEEAGDGSIGLKMFEESEPGYYDLILMDIQMPNMDGYEAAKRIRASNHCDGKNIPIIALTGNVFKDDMEKSKKSGMNAHLAKPLEYDRLIEVLARLLCK